MKALILAAGYATRLYPLTKEYPKPLLEIGDRPMINYIIEKLEEVKRIDEIIVVTNSKFFSKFKEWKNHLQARKPICLIDDLTSSLEDRRGAIGDMNFVIDKMGIVSDLLVIGGDNLFNDALGNFLSFAFSKAPLPSIGAYDIQDISQAKKYGVVKLDTACRIVDFKEKPQQPESTLVAMCLYFFPREQLGLIREYLSFKRDKHDATGFYIDWLKDRITVYAYVFSGRWYDIGHRDFYYEAKHTFLGKEKLARGNVKRTQKKRGGL